MAIGELVNSKVKSGDMTDFAEQDQRVNFLTTLLDVLILALRKSNQDGDQLISTLMEPFSTVVGIVNTSSNPIPVIKASICVKSYLLYLFPQVEKSQLTGQIYSMLDRLLDPKEQETISFYLGNILMILFEKVRILELGPQE